jgi:hypothetical protein
MKEEKSRKTLSDYFSWPDLLTQILIKVTQYYMAASGTSIDKIISKPTQGQVLSGRLFNPSIIAIFNSFIEVELGLSKTTGRPGYDEDVRRYCFGLSCCDFCCPLRGATSTRPCIIG